MKLCEHPLYRADLARALEANDFSALAGRRVLITGATGLIGSALTDLLLQLNRGGAEIRVYAAGRSAEKIRARFGDEPLLIPVPYDALGPASFDFDADYIIHTAGNASPEAYVKDPVGTMLGNVHGMLELLRYGLACGAEKTVYLSSSEVYGTGGTGEAFTEGQYGYVDLLNPRSSYPMGKRAAETLCACYASQYGSRVSIARPGHIYGPTASVRDGRVSSAFAWQAARGEALTLKSAGSQLRSYCYCVDCAGAILQILLRGESCEAYNIANPASVITIRRMAELLAEAGGVPLLGRAPTEAERAAFNPMDNSSLNSDKLLALGWQGVFSAEEGLAHTVDILRACL